MIALQMSNITAPTRFPNSLHASFLKMLVNLVPYPRLHFFSISYAPFSGLTKNSNQIDKYASEIINSLFWDKCM